MSSAPAMHGEKEMSAYLFVDTFAFEKLAAQPECRVGQRGALMTGYETYIIEQWACERRINTVVASYTGNAQHTVEVQVLLVPANLDKWSPATFAHFEELVRMHILPKETPLGNMLVTSLSSLPSNLSLVNMTQQFRPSFAYFVVNENLRRLNVVGRTAVTAELPSDSMGATFRRAFLTPAAVPLCYAAQEVGTLIQIALFYFGLLDAAMVDGLLCDHTLKAIEIWWSSFGRQRFKVAVPRQQDKLYMRLSCAALVGTVTGARQRLSAVGMKPPKDPFDAENFVECIRRFQKLTKIPRTSRLDDQTYFKLIQETAKSGSLGSSGVLTAMKSTVKEGLSGKASEAVDDWETLNLEQLVHNVRGVRAKYLWQGKGAGCVPHLLSTIPTSSVGARTRIPLVSLAVDGADRYHSHLQVPHGAGSKGAPAAAGGGDGAAAAGPAGGNVAPGAGAGTGAAAASHAPGTGGAPSMAAAFAGSTAPGGTSISNNNNNNNNTHSNYGGSGGSGSGSGPGHADVQAHDYAESRRDYDADHPLSAREHSHESHASLIHRFRKRGKAGLGDAFDERSPAHAAPAPPHVRTQSASSENWFVKQGQSMGMLSSPPPLSDAEGNSESDNPSSREDATSQRAPSAEPRAKPARIILTPSMLLCHDDLAVPAVEAAPGWPLKGADDLRRTVSLSVIDQNLFGWDALASEPRVLSMYGHAQELQRALACRMQRNEKLAAQVETDMAANEPRLAEAQRDNLLMKYHVTASMKKEDAVHRRVKELEAFMARLDYELATLNVKLRDVDQSVLAFAAKVSSLDNKWSTVKNVQMAPWWLRLFKW